MYLGFSCLLLSPPSHFDSIPLSFPPPLPTDLSHLKRKLKHLLNPVAMSILTAFLMNQINVLC